MGPLDYLIIAAIVLLVGGAVTYIIISKKRGQKCIGCPDSKTCSGHCSGCNGACHSTEASDK